MYVSIRVEKKQWSKQNKEMMGEVILFPTFVHEMFGCDEDNNKKQQSQIKPYFSLNILCQSAVFIIFSQILHDSAGLINIRSNAQKYRSTDLVNILRSRFCSIHKVMHIRPLIKDLNIDLSNNRECGYFSKASSASDAYNYSFVKN